MGSGEGTARATSKGAGAGRRDGRSRKRLVDDITRQLRDFILEHEIEPGTKLLQTEWSERLNVSRTPLREAFRILEQDGLVRVADGNRTIEVTSYTPDELYDLYEVREVIDGLSARLLASEGLSDDLDRELRQLLDEMDAVTEPFEPAKWFPAHTAFHMRIAESCGNRRLKSQLNLIRVTCFSLHAQLTDNIKDENLAHVLDVTRDQHEAIYRAIREGDEARAETTACRHIRATLEGGLIYRSVRRGAS